MFRLSWICNWILKNLKPYFIILVEIDFEYKIWVVIWENEILWTVNKAVKMKHKYIVLAVEVLLNKY